MKTITSSSNFRRLIATALVGVVCSSFNALPAAASDSAMDQKLAVKYADLDVSTQLGAAVLYGRITSAAEAVCSPYIENDLSSKMHVHVCVDKAIRDAVATVGVPALTGIYVAAQGKRAPIQIASL
jgi:UrcA family protein